MSDILEPVTLPDLISIGAQSIAQNAKALGLTWTLRPATVQTFADGGSNVNVICDGDEEIITVVNLTGTVYSDDRVMVMMVPPSGNYVIGWVEPIIPMRFLTSDSSTGSLAGIVGETVVLTISAFTFREGHAYQVEVRNDILSSNATNSALWRIRRTGLAGTLMAAGVWALRSGVSGSNDCGTEIIIKNTGADVTDDLVLTLATSGAGSITRNAATTQVAWLKIFDIGLADDFPLAINI